MAKTVDVEQLDKELADATSKLNKKFKGLVNELAKTNKAVALQTAETRLGAKETFSGFLASAKMDKAIRETDRKILDEKTAGHKKLVDAEEKEISRNKQINDTKAELATLEAQLKKDGTLSTEKRLEKQEAIDSKREKIETDINAIKKFRAKDIEKIENERTKAEEAYNEVIKDASSSEEFDNFSGSLKNLTGGLLDIGGMLDDVTKFGNDIKNVGAGIASAFGKLTSFGANISELGQGLAGKGSPFERLKNEVMKLVTAIGALWLSFKTKMKDIAGGIGKRANDMKDNVTKKFGDGKAFVADSINNKVTAGKDFVTGKVTAGKDKVTEGFTKGKDAMMDSVSKLGNNMKMGAKSLGGKGLKAIKMAPKMLMKGATRFVSLLARIPAMLAAIPALLASPIVLIGLAVLALIIGLVIIWVKFKDQIIEKFEMMKTKVTGVVTSLIDGFLEVWQKVKDWFGDKVHGIKKFLGLTTEEEDAEQEKKKLEKQQKKEAMKLKEEEIDAQMKEKFGDKSLNFFGGSKEAKEEKKRMMEEAAGNYDENLKLDNTSSKDLLEDRDNAINNAAAAADQLDARKKEVERRMSDPNDQSVKDGKGNVLEGEAKRAVLEDLADRGKLVRDEIFELSNKQLENYFDQKYSDSDKAQAELETREDFIPINFANQGRIKELREIDGEGDLDGPGLTEKERMELTRLERDQGDRIKDSADRAKEMGPKRESIQSTAIAQQNTNNNVTNNTISSSPNPRPTDTTINRTATVNQN